MGLMAREGLCVYYADTVQNGESKNMLTNFCRCLRQILTDVQNSFTDAVRGKSAMQRSSDMPPHLNSVATLPRETYQRRRQRTEDEACDGGSKDTARTEKQSVLEAELELRHPAEQDGEGGSQLSDHQSLSLRSTVYRQRLEKQESPANAKGTRDSSACMKAHCEQM